MPRAVINNLTSKWTWLSIRNCGYQFLSSFLIEFRLTTKASAFPFLFLRSNYVDFLQLKLTPSAVGTKNKKLILTRNCCIGFMMFHGIVQCSWRFVLALPWYVCQSAITVLIYNAYYKVHCSIFYHTKINQKRFYLNEGGGID